MNIKPLHDKVIIKPVEAENKTAGGIVLPNSAQKKSTRGKILAVGDGKMLNNGEIQPLNVKIGDIVIFNEGYTTKSEKIDEVEVLIMPESDILAVVTA